VLCCTEFFIGVENKIVKLEIKYVAADWRGYVVRFRLGSILFTAGFIFISVFVLYVVGSRFLTESISETLRFILVVFLFGIPTTSVLINLVDVERKARAKARQRSVLITADEIGVSYTEEKRSAAFEWSAYVRGYEQKDRFVFTSSAGGLLVPKRCFSSAQQLADFRELAKQGLNGKFRIA
jgi:hypothetical protein